MNNDLYAMTLLPATGLAEPFVFDREVSRTVSLDSCSSDDD